MKEKTALVPLHNILIENLKDERAIQIAKKYNITTYKELEVLIYVNNPEIITNKIILQSFLDAAQCKNISLEYITISGLKKNPNIANILEENSITTYKELEEALDNGIIEENIHLRNGLEIIKDLIKDNNKNKEKTRIYVDK